MAKSSKLSKSAKSERQKLIDATMKKQRGAEKRRGNVIIGAAVLIAVAIIAVPVVPQVVNAVETQQYADEPITAIGAGTDACQEVVERNASGVSNHVPQGQEVVYEDAPPAFGAHWSAPGAPASFDRKFYTADDRPELEELVHNLEHGYTILWYDETVADDSGAVNEIRAVASKFSSDSDNDNYRLKFIAAPWTSDDEDGAAFPEGQHVAFTHWKGTSEASTGVWQYCSQFSGQALTDFMDAYPYTDSPEAGAI